MINELLSQLDAPFTGEVLFDHVHDIVFFIKDCDCRYLVVNQTLVERCGLKFKSEILGKTASEVLSPSLGCGFTLQDHDVLETGQPLISQLELHLDAKRESTWCLTTKLPLKGNQGTIVGLVGISQDLRIPDVRTEEYSHVAAAIQHGENNLANPPTAPELAKVAGMSKYQLDRRMLHLFGLTTIQWMTKTRIDYAQRLLVTTNQSAAEIAHQTGYTDQSAFTRQFRHSTGLSPMQYRDAKSVK
ncbi:MAG: helix-turn-helix domain-containing protein [Aureliella sp.]